MDQPKTKAELRQAHGTPAEFEAACMRAWPDGYCTFEEAVKATQYYEAEYDNAPDTTPDIASTDGSNTISSA